MQSRSLQAFAFTVVVVLSSSSLPSHAAPAAALSAEEIHAIGVDAYLYFYPLLTMDITRKQMTNVQPGKGFGAPMNVFDNVPAYPDADFKGVVRSNFDTLYSSVWLDLTQEPLVLTAPDTHGRYYLLPMLDMWTDVFASPGSRTTGTSAARYLLTPPGWTGKVPAGFEQIAAPTPQIWIIGRTKTDGPSDYAAVHAIQAGYTITPLSQWGKAPVAPVVKIDPTIDMKTPPKAQVDGMSAAAYFGYAEKLFALHPPHATDQPILARMKRIGLEPGASFDFSKLDPAVQKVLAGVPADAQKLMAWKVATLARVENGWSLNTDTMGVYGNYYLKRAIVSQVGLGANLPEDAIYPLNLADDTGKPLDGGHQYSIHFDKGATPAVDAFWSITLYDSDGFQVGNELNRFAVSSWMPFKTNADGSLDLYIQNENPGKDKVANWLPAPKGAFNLTMRLYSPKSEALTGKWIPPAIERAK